MAAQPVMAPEQGWRMSPSDRVRTASFEQAASLQKWDDDACAACMTSLAEIADQAAALVVEGGARLPVPPPEPADNRSPA
ncbi:MAG: hypothetical protein AAF467_21945 [Actinomycetota bacterium]